MKDWKTYAIVVLIGLVAYLFYSRPATVTIREVGCVDHVARVIIGGVVRDTGDFPPDWFVEISTNEAQKIVTDAYSRTIEAAKDGRHFWHTADEIKKRQKEVMESIKRDIDSKRKSHQP